MLIYCVFFIFLKVYTSIPNNSFYLDFCKYLTFEIGSSSV